MCMISLLTCCMGHAGAPGVLASPFAAMHGLGSPLTSPYGNSAVGGMGGMHFNTLFCSVLFSPLLFKLCCPILWYSFDAWTTIFQILYSLPSFLAIYYGFLTWLSDAVRTCQNFNIEFYGKRNTWNLKTFEWLLSCWKVQVFLLLMSSVIHLCWLIWVAFLCLMHIILLCASSESSLLVLVASFFAQKQQPVSL